MLGIAGRASMYADWGHGDADSDCQLEKVIWMKREYPTIHKKWRLL